MRRAAAGAVVAIPAAVIWLSAGGSVDPVLVVLIVVAALCWVIIDPGRSKRLTMLIQAWRGGRQRSETRRSGSSPDNTDGSSRSRYLSGPPPHGRAKGAR
jgi:hypothetical protein